MKAVYQHTLIILLSLVGLFTSCKKFLDIPPPETQIQTSEIFSDDQSAVSAVSGLYKRLIINNLVIANGGMTVFCGLSADELFNTTPTPELDQLRTNSILADNTDISADLWQAAYKNIYQANAILEGLGKSTIDAVLAKQLKGETLVVRALNYFYLINLFGDVPFANSTDYALNQSLPRTSASEIYKQLESDLAEAQMLLSADYPSPFRARPNKWTAAALLARVYLYEKKWPDALAQSDAVINSGTYSLEPDLNNVFLSSSNETIWSLPQETTNTSEGQVFIPAFSFIKPPYGLTDSLLNAFELNDARRTSWVASGTANGLPISYPYKYKKGYDFSSPPPPVTEYYVVFRLAEQYLIRAEAEAEGNDLSSAEADLNTIRTRAALPNTTANNKDDLLAAIGRERRIEFFAEWGHRWLDLKRTGDVDGVLDIEKSPNWQSSDFLYPIPSGQIELNPALTQNSGY